MWNGLSGRGTGREGKRDIVPQSDIGGKSKYENKTYGLAITPSQVPIGGKSKYITKIRPRDWQ